MDVVNPLQVAVVNGAAATLGHDLTNKYDEKMKKYGEGCRRAGISLLPSAHGDTWWVAQPDRVLGEEAGVCPCQADWGCDEGECTRHLFQRNQVLMEWNIISLMQ